MCFTTVKLSERVCLFGYQVYHVHDNEFYSPAPTCPPGSGGYITSKMVMIKEAQYGELSKLKHYYEEGNFIAKLYAFIKCNFYKMLLIIKRFPLTDLRFLD